MSTGGSSGFGGLDGGRAIDAGERDGGGFRRPDGGAIIDAERPDRPAPTDGSFRREVGGMLDAVRREVPTPLARDGGFGRDGGTRRD
jgi:hypothetical protein